jgi:hypothetical protein
MTDERWPFSADIGTIGIPFVSFDWVYSQPREDVLFERIAAAPPNSKCFWALLQAIVSPMVFWPNRGSVWPEMHLKHLTALVENGAVPYLDFDLVEVLLERPHQSDEFHRLLATFSERHWVSKSPYPQLTAKICSLPKDTLSDERVAIAIATLMTRQSELAKLFPKHTDATHPENLVAAVQAVLLNEDRSTDVQLLCERIRQSPEWLEIVLGAFESEDAPLRASESILEFLMKTIPAEDFTARGRAIELLDQHIARARSGLAEQAVWSELALPEGLSTVLRRYDN